MKNFQDIGKQIKDKLEGAQKAPNDLVWEKIEKTLDDRQRNYLKFFWILGVLSLATVILVVSDLITNDEENQLTKTNEALEKVEAETQNKTTTSTTTFIDLEVNEKLYSTSDAETWKDHPEFIKQKERNTVKFDSETATAKKSVDNEEIIHNTTTVAVSNSEQTNNTNQQISEKNNTQKTSPVKTNLKDPFTTDGERKAADTNNAVSEAATTSEKLLPKTASGFPQPKTGIVYTEEEADSLKIKAKKEKNKEEKTKENNEDEKIEELIEETEEKKDSFWAAGIYAYPLIYNTSGKGSMLDSFLDDYSTKARIYFSYGLTLDLRVSQNIYLSLGLGSTKLGYTISGVPAVTTEDLTRISQIDAFRGGGTTVGRLEDFASQDASLDLIHEMSYVELPLHFLYRTNHQRLGFEGLAGFSTYYLSGSTVYAENASGDRLALGDTQNISKVSLSLNFGAGVYYQITNDLQCYFTPIYKYHFRISNDHGFGSEGRMFGIQTGIIYKL
jgi:hypothetical protein